MYCNGSQDHLNYWDKQSLRNRKNVKILFTRTLADAPFDKNLLLGGEEPDRTYRTFDEYRIRLAALLWIRLTC